ncbi:hypothetical protein SD51_13295 [Alicyclobacillus tengchongensis]|nr:hypothetical protein SD51_13295 [Alicyclobacillus tengchongensis]
MKKILIMGGALLLILSLLANVYLLNETEKLRATADRDIFNALGLLQAATTMKIIPNSQGNSPETRALMIGEAGVYLDASASSLSHLGVHDMDKIAYTLEGIAFPMMFPDMLNVNQSQMFNFVVKVTHLLEDCTQDNSVNLKKLQNAIDVSEQTLPNHISN